MAWYCKKRIRKKQSYSNPWNVKDNVSMGVWLYSLTLKTTLYSRRFNEDSAQSDLPYCWICHRLHFTDLPQHEDVIKWKHFPRYWPFVRGIHRSPVNSPHKGQWRGAFMLTLIWARINGWVNNCEASDLRRNLAYYDVIVMKKSFTSSV